MWMRKRMVKVYFSLLLILLPAISSLAKESEKLRSILKIKVREFGEIKVDSNGYRHERFPFFRYSKDINIHIIGKKHRPIIRLKNGDRWHRISGSRRIPVEITWHGVGEVEKLVVVDTLAESLMFEPHYRRYSVLKSVNHPASGQRVLQLSIERPYLRPHGIEGWCPRDLVLMVMLKTRDGRYLRRVKHFLVCDTKSDNTKFDGAGARFGHGPANSVIRSLYDAIYHEFGIPEKQGGRTVRRRIPVFRKNERINILLRPYMGNRTGERNHPDYWYIFENRNRIALEVSWSGIGDVDKVVLLDPLFETHCKYDMSKAYRLLLIQGWPKPKDRRIRAIRQAPCIRPYYVKGACPLNMVLLALIRTKDGRHYYRLVQRYACEPRE